MGRIVRIIEPRVTTDIVYYRTVTVEYDGIEYTFNSEESDNGTNYFCAIDGGEMVEMDWNFDDDVARELCDKVFEAYQEGIIDENIEDEFDMDIL